MKLFGPLVVVVAVVAAFGAVLAGGNVLLLVLGVLALTVGAYVGLCHPTWLLWALAASMGLLPAGYFPGVHVPMVFTFVMGVLLATVLHPREVSRFTTMEKLLGALVAFSFISMVFTFTSIADPVEFIKWAAVTLLAIALLRLPRSQLARFGQIYVVSATISGLLAIVILFADSGGRIMNALSIFGYGAAANTEFKAYSGTTATTRLTGTFLEPNAAGIGLLVALLMCLILFTGRWRIGMGTILLVALVLTLSRSALFAIVVGVVLLVLLQSLSIRQRSTILGGFVVAFGVALAIPQIRARILSSFGSDDTSSSARLDAIKDFPSQIHGQWLFGRGWALPEFKNGTLAFTTNFVANAPLLSLYRGGALVTIAFVAALLYGCYLAYQCLRSTRWELGLYGGGFIGFFLVTMQLDIGTVTIPQSTAGLSFLIAFLIYAREKATHASADLNTPAVGDSAAARPVASI
ncbi:O-antigen ligase family protein [Williamsia maris]|uniref:O-antigen ligase family protein n=1 Tax=Williamsia maris TaxID=72806 RepID=UPI0020A25E22|nr:O-antigen ligase family protein [Williamsia maris]